MNRLIIADIKTPVVGGEPTGHYFAVAQNYHDMFHERIQTVIAGGPIYLARFSTAITPLPYNLEVKNGNKLVNIYKYFCNVRALFSRCENDIIVIQQGSDVAFLAACLLLCSKKKNNKIFLIQYNAVLLQSLFARVLFHFAKKKVNGIICPNQDVGEYFGLPYCVVPDYIYVPMDWNATTEYEKKYYDICMLGRIVEEKGIVEFLEHFANTSYKMIIAGRPASDELAERLRALTEKNDNISLMLGFITQEEYYQCINQSRFCVLNYQGEYSKRSSGAVLDMILNNVPVIGRDCKALAFIREWDMGYIYKDVNSIDLTAIITPQMHDFYIRNIARYKRTHLESMQQLGRFLGVCHAMIPSDVK